MLSYDTFLFIISMHVFNAAFCCVPRKICLIFFSIQKKKQTSYFGGVKPRHCVHCQCYKELRCLSSLQFFWRNIFCVAKRGAEGEKDKLKPLNILFGSENPSLKTCLAEIYSEIFFRGERKNKERMTCRVHKNILFNNFLSFSPLKRGKKKLFYVVFSLQNIFLFRSLFFR